MSEIIRQLGLAGIGLVWVFKVDVGGKPVIPTDLLVAAKWIVLGLGLDLLQFMYGSFIWAVFNRIKEWQDTNEETEFGAPGSINWPTNTFFWLKIGAMLIAYWYILKFLSGYLI